jgi:outer membrane protein assembly factor BamD
MNLRKVVYFAIMLWLPVQLLGCAWFQAKEEKTAQELAEEGMEAFRDKDYRKAIESFEKLKDWYPFSRYSILAELKLGDAHYHSKEYEEAIFAYDEFENLHPKNEAVPYVVYQIGRCYFDRLQSIDRDQTMAREALQTFARLIRTYPASSYAKKAEEHMKVCNKNLAEHEFYVGIFYYKTRHYKAALERFKTVLRSYPDLGVHRKALEYIPLCQDGINNAASANN